MKTDTTKATADAAEGTLFLGDDWFDPLEAGVRTRIRSFIEELLEAELDVALGRDRYERPRLAETGVGGRPVVGAGHRHGHRQRGLMGTFGPVTVRVPRARLEAPDGKTAEWKNATIPAYQRRTKRANALIAGAYFAGTNTRRVRRALAALFGGAVGKDTVSRVWRKVKGDWDAWNGRSLADDRPVDPRRDGGARAARPESDVHLAARRTRRPAGRPEDSSGGQEYGRRKRGSLASAPRRSCQTWPEDAGTRHRRRRPGAGCGAGCVVVRCRDSALHGAQASQPSRACAGAAARGNIERLQGYDLRRHEAGDRDEAHGVHPQVAPKVQGRRR